MLVAARAVALILIDFIPGKQHGHGLFTFGHNSRVFVGEFGDGYFGDEARARYNALKDMPSLRPHDGIAGHD